MYSLLPAGNSAQSVLLLLQDQVTLPRVYYSCSREADLDVQNVGVTGAGPDVQNVGVTERARRSRGPGGGPGGPEVVQEAGLKIKNAGRKRA